jgi:hypothetical protein
MYQQPNQPLPSQQQLLDVLANLTDKDIDGFVSKAQAMGMPASIISEGLETIRKIRANK